MKSNELMNPDFLDILFEKRNRDYGAYVIRRGYSQRLMKALGAALSLMLLFVLMNGRVKENLSAAPLSRKDPVVEIREITWKAEKPGLPEKMNHSIKPAEKRSSEKFLSRIEIKPDNQVKEKLPEQQSLAGKIISDSTRDGTKGDEITLAKEIPAEKDGLGDPLPVQKEPGFSAEEKEPEFPGGPQALKRFLANNLARPSDLEDGEKKMVQIRFRVEKDGLVNHFEIITSGGNELDEEVRRVCRQMPRWIPARQNGINVPVHYLLPVTFVGAVQ